MNPSTTLTPASSSDAEIKIEGPNVRRNSGISLLLEAAVQSNEGIFADNGAFCANTAPHTGRSAKDKFIVKDKITSDTVEWGAINQPFDPIAFDRLAQKMQTYLTTRNVFTQDVFAGAAVRHRLPVRVICELAWHSAFARQMFVQPFSYEMRSFQPKFTILCAPGFTADPPQDGTRSSAFVIISFSRRAALIGGTKYAGEIKKSVFTIMNFLLPDAGVFPMHCSANVGPNRDTALFFGLSGTGKTTLSADPERQLVGDDEHGWSDAGVFNFEGGCYAKCIRLSRKNEPEIWDAIRFGSILENVVLDADTRLPNYDDGSLTENSRVAYPLEYIPNTFPVPNAFPADIAKHPANIVFLTADAFGVLPPIAQLTPEQAIYYFLSGYTAKVAGTEAGMGSEPVATFSACFGAPFLPLPPMYYAGMLQKRLAAHKTQCWLVNTGWIGGPYGVGERVGLPYTRAMVRAALARKLTKFKGEEFFGLSIPSSCPQVPARLLNPRTSWKDKKAYDRAAAELAERFRKNFEKFKIAG
jgi:phosphoenolpyruvate carboxykinase (ATP)